VRAGIVLSLSSVAVLLGAGCGSSGGGSGPKVVAAFYPIAFAAEQIDPGAEVDNLTPAGAEPHDLELSARDVQRVEDADVVLYLGNGFMPALEKAVRGRSDAVDLLAGQRLVRGAGEEGETLDPHVWLDPIRYSAMVRRVGQALGRPKAAARLVARLRGLDARYRTGLTHCARREIVTSHAAFGYLASRYDLRQVPLAGLAPEAEPSARAIERLVDEVKRDGATTVFFETLVSPKLAETVAREAGVRTAVLDPIEGLTKDELSEGADYFSVMRDNLATLRQALGCT
jgi:zinc transport system substrate-binding protein